VNTDDEPETVDLAAPTRRDPMRECEASWRKPTRFFTLADIQLEDSDGYEHAL
jgi:hypothetical protein